MKNARFFLLTIVAALAAAALVPSGAGAQALYRYDVELGYSASVRNLDPLLTTTVRLMRGVTQLDRNNWGVGVTSASVYDYTLQAGDVVEVYQGAVNPPDPPGATLPTETYTVPSLTITASAGSPVISGSAAADSAVHVYHHPYCSGSEDSMLAANAGGAYSATFPVAMQPGESTVATAVEPDGDNVTVRYRVPGDAGCFYVDASAQQNGPSPDPKPFAVGEGGIDWAAIPTARIVLRRGAAIVAEANNSGIDLTPAEQPLAGDVVEVYRPQDAAAPVTTFTIPALSAVFDAGNDMVAVNAPAGALVEAYACRAFDCASGTSRAARNVPAGRTIFSYAQPLSYDRAFDIHPGDQVSADWTSQDERSYVVVDAVPGDLTSPIGKITLAKKLKLRKIGKKIKFKLDSSEVGSAVSTLTTTPPAKAKRKKGKTLAKKPITLAAATTALNVGTNTISLKVSKRGKKTIKKIIASGKAQTGTLQVTLTDAAGNATTVVKTTKLALK